MRNRCVAEDVFNCLNDLSPENFAQYFKSPHHGKHTRGDDVSLVLPPTKTECVKQMFAFQGAIIFNKLRKVIRDEPSLVRFKLKLNLYNT